MCWGELGQMELGGKFGVSLGRMKARKYGVTIRLKPVMWAAKRIHPRENK